MGRLHIAADGRHFVRDGKPFFYLADTVWSAFTNASLAEWADYLSYRRSQRFNALQISLLPLFHDASDTYTGEYPFLSDPDGDGAWQFDRVNEAFFDKAETMVKMACDSGFLPCLVVLWNNYVPGTWANGKAPQYTMPFAAVAPFAEYAARRFARYEPVYFISGDTAFENETVADYFAEALLAVKRTDPDALAAMHVVGNFHRLPDEIVRMSELDFYIYQSGHFAQEQSNAYVLAEAFGAKPVRRLTLNSEPCYEGHGHGDRYARYGAFDVRKAFWSSVLGGAGGGFGYGAHGVWSFHRRGAAFTSESFSKLPYDWSVALRLEGAWDVGFAGWLVERHRLYGLLPRQDLLDGIAAGYPDIRCAADEDANVVALYVPCSQNVHLKLDLSAYRVTAFDLGHRRAIAPELRPIGNNERMGSGLHDGNDGLRGTLVRMLEANADFLLIAER